MSSCTSSPFFLWLVAQRHRSDPAGRLADEAFRDPDYPRRAQRLCFLLDYYADRPDRRAAMKLAHREWRQARDEVR